MSGTQPRRTFEAVPDDPAPATDAATTAGTRMILAGLHALSQRALTAISDLFSLILVGAVWTLADHVLDNPSQLQIGTVFLFAAFCVLIDVIRRRSK
jgi:uncharacterized MAPEG superfamily protein